MAGKPKVLVSVYGGVVNVEVDGEVDVAVIEWDNEVFFSVASDPISFNQIVKLELEALWGVEPAADDEMDEGWTPENKEEALNYLRRLL